MGPPLRDRGTLLRGASFIFQEDTGSNQADTGWLEEEALEKLPALLEEKPERNFGLSLRSISVMNNKYPQASDTGKTPYHGCLLLPTGYLELPSLTAKVQG